MRKTLQTLCDEGYVSIASSSDESDRSAGFLAASGVGKSHIVTVCLPNWRETVVVFLATMKRGAVSIRSLSTYGQGRFGVALTKCDSRALFRPRPVPQHGFHSRRCRRWNTQSSRAARLCGSETALRHRDAEHGAESCAHTPNTTSVAIEADDPAACYSHRAQDSRSKGVVHTHNTILFGERALAGALDIDADDIAFMASPISHTTGSMHGVIMTLDERRRHCPLLDIFEGQAAASQLAEHRCTWTMGATPFLADISAALEASGARLPELRYFLCGGAPIPEVLVQRAADVGLMWIMSIYGIRSPPHAVVKSIRVIPQNAWSTDGQTARWN